MFKIKDWYKPEFGTSETMKLFSSTKKIMEKTKNGEKVPSFEVVERDLVQCNLVDNQYQQVWSIIHALLKSLMVIY